MAHVLVVKLHPLCGRVGVGPGLLQIFSLGCDAQHPSAVCDDLSVRLFCPCVEAVVTLVFLKFIQPCNGKSLLVGDRIPFRCQHHADSRIVLKLQIDLIQGAVDAGLRHVDDVVLHPGQDHLGLRIPEAGIVLQHFRPFLCQHQAEEDHAFEGAPLRFHGVNRGLENIFLAERIHLFCVERARRKCTHTACVKASVSVPGPLVVLGACHGLYNIAVHKGEDRHFPAGHELLNDHGVAGSSEFLVQHDGLHAFLRLLQGVADENSLAQSQAVRLEDDGEFRLCLQILDGLVRIVKILIGRCGDMVFFHQIFGKCLGTFQDGCIFPGAEGADACRLQLIHQAAYQRIVHAHNDKVNGFLLCKSHDLVKLHGADGLALCVLSDARIARCAVYFIRFGTFRHAVRDGVLPSAASYNQYIHWSSSCLPGFTGS